MVAASVATVTVVPVAFVNEILGSVETPDTFKYPVARIFVEETETREDWPEMLSETPWRYPDAVTLVPDALVKNKLGNRP